MSRFYKGMVLRTSYGTGPYIVESVIEGCTCPKYLDSLNMGDKAPRSQEHCHITCKDVNGKGNFYLNGYDENLNSVWNDDRLIVPDEELLLTTLLL